MLVSYASNRYYLSGFELHDVQLNESAGSLVITRDGRDYLCTDARYTDAARAIWPENDIYIYSGSIPQALRRLLACCGSRIGFEAGSVSAAFAKELSEGLTLEPCDGMVEELRLIKEPEEIASLEKSFAVNHAMLKWIKGEIREGMTEAEVSWMIERYFREHGASELAFPSIVAFGENGALPHAISCRRRRAMPSSTCTPACRCPTPITWPWTSSGRPERMHTSRTASVTAWDSTRTKSPR